MPYPRLYSLACLLALTICTTLEARSGLSQSREDTHPIPYPLRVIDLETGMAIQGATLDGQKVVDAAPDHLAHMGTTDKDGDFKGLALAPGKYAIEIAADGYKGGRFVLGVARGTELTLETIPLKPSAKPKPLADLFARAKAGSDMVGGYVFDSDHRSPVNGAKLSFEKSGLSATSDSTGFFAVEIPVSPDDTSADAEIDPSKLETVKVSAPGYKAYTFSQLELEDASARALHIPLEKGVGSTNATEALSSSVGGNTEEHQEDVETAEPDTPALIDWLTHRETKTKPSPQDETMEALASGASTAITGSIVMPDVVYVGSECHRVPTSTGHKKLQCSTVTPYHLKCT
jgi:hypothetical protein